MNNTGTTERTAVLDQALTDLGLAPVGIGELEVGTAPEDDARGSVSIERTLAENASSRIVLHLKAWNTERRDPITVRGGVERQHQSDDFILTLLDGEVELAAPTLQGLADALAKLALIA